MMKRTGVILGVTLAALLGACGNDVTVPQGYNWSGTWTGLVEDATFGVGTVGLTLHQSDNQLNGNGTLVLEALVVPGTVTGTATITELDLTVSAPSPTSCSFSMKGTRKGNTVTGTYAPVRCPAAVGGTFTLTAPVTAY
jgi:hypothetical protein